MIHVKSEQKEEISVRAHVFIREEQRSSTEAKDNERSLCVKHQQVHTVTLLLKCFRIRCKR